MWHLLPDPDARFHDLGPGYYDARIDPERRKRNHIRQLEAPGYTRHPRIRSLIRRANLARLRCAPPGAAARR